MEDREVRLRELQEELSRFRSLIEHRGWKEMIAIANEQMKLRLGNILSAVQSQDELITREFEKGEMNGIDLFCRLPMARITALEEDVNALEQELGYDGQTGTDGNDGSGDGGEFSGSAPTV